LKINSLCFSFQFFRYILKVQTFQLKQNMSKLNVSIILTAFAVIILGSFEFKSVVAKSVENNKLLIKNEHDQDKNSSIKENPNFRLLILLHYNN